MTSFHVLHWMPDPGQHIFNGYNEVIETVIWGLNALGHEATYAVNRLREGAVPIVFGAQMMTKSVLSSLPQSSILYNLEQLHGLQAAGRVLDELSWASQFLTVWDYSSVNVENWRRLGARDVAHVPIGYAPFLSRITGSVEQDIDVLIYGAPSDRRVAMLVELCARGLSVMFLCGLYGAGRDALIARAKLVLCITSNQHSSIFSIVRASYLLANRKAVVADLALVERDIANAVAFAPLDHVATLCCQLLSSHSKRHRLENVGHDVITQRDVRTILGSVLGRNT